ncbi:hypothetical protein RJ639_044884 [Escallonia herrerae]|uniref:Reverse transcriptase RNase H-like domain-containing protein n=1 Tax=Escallonia herrerae TaxID=1293975 RepID=A0AA89B2C4_9ASTE|nr:hypothetical protein RJ639_024078 [Escallonia herrerae]KAK3025080.1 hypothetical protein RJ639_044884 [Escallonia herrerae]
MSFEWDQACQNAFHSIKRYLLSHPVLGALTLGKPLILYIVAQEESLGAMLMETELKYNLTEKTCLVLVFGSQKLRHYFLAYTMHLIARADPLKYVMAKIVPSGRLANEFEIVYVLRTTIKGQALADFLLDHPIPADWEISEDFLEE